MFPRKTALIFDGQSIEYSEMETRCNRLAHAMIERGVRRGDRVAIWLENSPEVIIALFAALKAGAIFVVLNSTTKAEKIEYALNNCRARALVTDRRRADSFQKHWSVVPHLEMAWIVGQSERIDVQPTDKSLASLSRDLENHALPSSPPKKHAIDIDLAALIYTSGSSGVPRGVMMTHLSMISAANSITTYLESTSDDIVLNFLPLSFDYGLYQVLMAFKCGATLVLERSLGYRFAVIETLLREKITGFPIVPTIASVLLQMNLKGREFPHLRYITNTAAVLPVDKIRQ